MKTLSFFAILIMIAIPFGAAFDSNYEREDNRTQEPWIPWSPDIEPVEELSPWWERTVFDADHNGISDVLEPYAALSISDHILTDVTITFSRDIDGSDMDMLLTRGFEISTPLEIIDGIALKNVPSYRIYELMNMEDVVFIEPLGIPVLYADIANPTVRAKQSEQFSPWTAWDLGYQGRGVSISVIDTGIDDEHPSLSGKFLAGVDMTKPDNMNILYPQDGSFNPDDIQGHGSTCSGIATGTGAPEGEYQGPAPEARLVDIRIGTKIGYAPGEFWVGSQSDPHLKDGTLRGIRWATENLNTPWAEGGNDYEGIDIYSISWGVDVGMDSDGTDQYSRLLDAAVDSGAIVINAAGNDGPTNTGFTGLSASSKAIIVAATVDMDTIEQEDDVVAWYSSRGPRTDNNDGNPYDELKPDIAAPGTNITQMQPDTTRLIGDASNNGYGNRGSGTSYATPLVAGVVALILEANPSLDEQNEIVNEVMKFTADRKKPATYPELDPFWERDFGYGVVDAYAAVRLAEEMPLVASVDPRLQAHITGLETTNFTKPYYTYYVNSTFEISGLGWSKGGQFERTEYSIDGGKWTEMPDQVNETFNPWSLKVEGLDLGPHNIRVRSVAGDKESLYSFVDIEVTRLVTKEGQFSGASLLVPMTLIILAGLCVGIFIYMKTKRKQTTP